MSDMKPRQALHRSANVRRDTWERRVRSDAPCNTPILAEAGTRIEGESHVVRRTAAWDLSEHSLSSEYLGMRSKNQIRNNSSPTLPGFPVALHDRGDNASGELAYRFTDADGHERTVSERREPSAGPCIVTYADLMDKTRGGEWELGYLATVALCRMLVKERFTGRFSADSVGMDPAGRVVWAKRPEDSRYAAVATSYIGELNPGQLVRELGTMFYRFVTGLEPGDDMTAPSELNVQAPIWVDAVSNAALGEAACESVADFLDLLHQYSSDEQREQMNARLAEWALRTRRLSQPTEDVVAVHLGAALSQLGVAAKERTRRSRRRRLLPVGVATLATVLGAAAVILRSLRVI